MKTKKVAVVGAFDLDNYGDLLFPLVLKNTFGRDIELTVYGPVGGSPQLGGADVDVRSILLLESDVRTQDYSAIIVGGGALIHLQALYQMLPGIKHPVRYNIGLTWLVPSIIGRLTGVPVIWNAPDVPFEIPHEMIDLVNELLATVDYISVRNESSRDRLEKIGVDGKRISVVPDSAFGLLWAQQSITGVINRSLVRDEVVVHINRFISPDELSGFSRLVEMMAEKNRVTPVLLPLANTHLDREAAQTLSSQLRCAHRISAANSIQDIIAEISTASAYVGVSYHGMITALVNNVPTIAFNYMKFDKSRDLMSEVGLEDHYAEDLLSLRAILEKHERFHRSDMSEAIAPLEERLRAHFSKMEEVVAVSPGMRQHMTAESASLLSSIITATAAGIRDCNSLDDRLSKLEAVVSATSHSLRALHTYTHAKISYLEEQI